MKTNNQTIIAVDPGESGGIAILENDTVTAQAMPDDVALTSLFRGYVGVSPIQDWFKQPVVYMEQVGGFIKGNPAPGSAMFNFGDGFGFIRGLCAAFGIKLVLVRPQLWQKGIPYAASSKDKAERKRAYLEHAGRMFPLTKWILKTGDAGCILDYARHVEGFDRVYADVKANMERDHPGATVSRVLIDGLPAPTVAKTRKTKPTRYSEAQAALAWCRFHGWEPPLTGTKEFSEMIRHYRESLASMGE